jgi:hypothetical protein
LPKAPGIIIAGASNILLAPPLILDDEDVELGVEELDIDDGALLDGVVLDSAVLEGATLEAGVLLDEPGATELGVELDDVLLLAGL